VDAIVAKSLEKRYGSVRALAGVTLSVGAGEVFDPRTERGGRGRGAARTVAATVKRRRR
jgi:ABC-type histidine transport system ATPase subunit